MFQLIESNDNYKLYHCQFIKNNVKDFISDCNIVYKRFNHQFPNESTTKFFRYYNMEGLSVGLTNFYLLFTNLKKLIRQIVNHNNPLWYQCWINFHEYGKTLDWHTHDECSLHGYLSIDPKDSNTMFKDYSINNEIGKLYLGNPSSPHKVCVNKYYIGHRITIAFDVYDNNDIQKTINTHGVHATNIGFVAIE